MKIDRFSMTPRTGVIAYGVAFADGLMAIRSGAIDVNPGTISRGLRRRLLRESREANVRKPWSRK